MNPTAKVSRVCRGFVGMIVGLTLAALVVAMLLPPVVVATVWLWATRHRGGTAVLAAATAASVAAVVFATWVGPDVRVRPLRQGAAVRHGFGPRVPGRTWPGPSSST